jgi:hypothetical protein
MRRSLAVLVALIAVAACSSEPDRPTVADWQSQWIDAVAQVPTVDDLTGADAPEDVCDEALAAVRDDRSGSLDTTPSATIDTAFEDWTKATETYLFECPIDDSDELEELERASVEAADRVDDLVGSG